MFIKYIHVERIGKKETDGLLNGDVYLTSKVDGTNASVWYNNGIHAGSRKREITPENDNAEFANYIINSCDDVAVKCREFCMKYPGIHVFGEWLGDPTNNSKMQGSIRKYNRKGFFVFDLYDEKNASEEDKQRNIGYLSPKDERYNELKDLLGDNFIVPFAKVTNPTTEQIIDLISGTHFNLPDDVQPEGVVCKRYNFRSMYGNLEFGKIILDEFQQKRTNFKKKYDSHEQEFVAEFCTNAFIEKCKIKTAEKFGDTEFDTKSNKHIGFLSNLVYTDLIREEFADYALKHKVKSIDLGKIRTICRVIVNENINRKEEN